jgi:putative aldouronate transport system substrate-binding protein
MEGNSIFAATNSAFGIGNLGNSNARSSYIDLGADGKIRLFAITESFRQQLTWIAGLYAKGLLDPEMFTHDIPTFTAKGEQDLIGAFFHNANPEIIGAINQDYFVPCPAFIGKDGKPAVFNNLSLTYGLGAFAISNKNKHLPETLRWIDYYYGDEGALLLWLGEPGVTYNKNADGSFTLTDLVLKNPNGLNLPQAMGQYAIGFAGGACPVYTTESLERARLQPVVFTAYDMIEPTISIEALPLLSFTIAEQDELNALTSDIKTYIDESRIQFITGRLPLSQWDNYVRTINNMGAARYTAILQASYDRWSKK